MKWLVEVAAHAVLNLQQLVLNFSSVIFSPVVRFLQMSGSTRVLAGMLTDMASRTALGSAVWNNSIGSEVEVHTQQKGKIDYWDSNIAADARTMKESFND